MSGHTLRLPRHAQHIRRAPYSVHIAPATPTMHVASATTTFIPRMEGLLRTLRHTVAHAVARALCLLRAMCLL